MFSVGWMAIIYSTYSLPDKQVLIFILINSAAVDILIHISWCTFMEQFLTYGIIRTLSEFEVWWIFSNYAPESLHPCTLPNSVWVQLFWHVFNSGQFQTLKILPGRRDILLLLCFSNHQRGWASFKLFLGSCICFCLRLAGSYPLSSEWCIRL